MNEKKALKAQDMIGEGQEGEEGDVHRSRAGRQ